MSLDIEYLKKLRDRKGWTLAEAATQAGLKSAQHYENIESGRSANVTLTTLDKLAAAYGVSPKSLIK
jgi:transcriptional regulator with XRE-family HTH domain